MSELLGFTPMPHQHQIWNVGLEIDPDTGVFVYREVRATMMRQSSKTTSVLCLKLDRGLNFGKEHGPQRIQYSAQTGKDGREKMLDDEWPLIKKSKLRPAMLEPRRSNGNEAFRFKNGSLVLNLASDQASGHGKTTDLGIIDEAFADVDDRREQAILPAMATKPWAQLWVTSTAGTAASPYLWRKVETGREYVDKGTCAKEGVAYFEWSVPEDEDIDSPDVWARYMPAYGYTISDRAIRHARGNMVEGEFRRAWCNQWTIAAERTLPAEDWAAVVDEEAVPVGRVVLAVDVSPERSSAAIAAADADGCVELIDHRPGVGWLTERVLEVASRQNAKVVVDSMSPAHSFGDEWDRQGLSVERLSSREMAGACGSFYDAVVNHTVTVRQHPALDKAAEGARKRISGDVWFWARKDNSVDVCPLVAASIARWAASDVNSTYEAGGLSVIG